MRIYSAPTSIETAPSNSSITVLGIISEGRMFRIYQAQKGSKYIILKTPVTNDSMLIEILRREYELACNLNHPCVVSTLEFNPHTPVGPALVMEYIDGLTLDEFVASNPTLEERKAVLNDILDGLDYLHHRGIIHNDLKPDNIIVNSNKAARIIDFGFSASTDSAYKGYIGGSDGYTAPEILNGSGSAGTTSDIFTLGRLINLIFGGRKYGEVARRCSRQNPSERPQNIQALRVLIKRRNRRPLLVASVAASIVVALFIAASIVYRHNETVQMERRIAQSMDSVYQKTTDKIEAQTQRDSLQTDQRIEEKVVSYTQETEQTKLAQKLQRRKKLIEQFEKEMNPPYERAITRMKKQKYKELAIVYAGAYYYFMTPYLKSITRKYPPLPDGSVAEETDAAFAVYLRQHNTIDSLHSSLPSINTLPPAQRDSIIRVINQLKP
ncbi:protein kinase [Barnesiella sp. An55]|uniref:serine/threonine protein kinase n=1 Tax=Barnesiella sp. An55 TaxID=1965646 RepID=UPI000B37B9CA|nr:protein kinase [Barnesiella sp. An55]OUN71173.1 hypothetical protein B5G10_09470 [Barnesiella sp. An55]